MSQSSITNIFLNVTLTVIFGVVLIRAESLYFDFSDQLDIVIETLHNFSMYLKTYKAMTHVLE